MTIVFLIEWNDWYRVTTLRWMYMTIYDEGLLCDSNDNNVNEQGYLYYNIK